jgi:hypothetical protein
VVKKTIIVDGYVYRHVNTLTNGDVVYVCNINKKCNKSITTDPKGGAVVKTKNKHSCGKEPIPEKMNLDYLGCGYGTNLAMLLGVRLQ